MLSGLALCLPAFITEISEDKRRGTLLSIFDPCFNVGSIFAYVLSYHFDYVTQAKILLIIPIIFIFVFLAVPHSPTYLLTKQKKEVIYD